RLVPLGALRNAAVASSAVAGDTPAPPRCERSFPGHILARGRPPTPGLWTVLARSAWRADALTKVAACAAPGQHAAQVARLGGHLVSPSSGTLA
ncbi:MAG: hypothetical protein RJA10_2163, partial [Pseudomonadota bacterium]